MLSIMSDQYSSHYTQEQGDDDFDWSQWPQMNTEQSQNIVNNYINQPIIGVPAGQVFDTRQQVYDFQQLFSSQQQQPQPQPQQQQQQQGHTQYPWQYQPAEHAQPLQSPHQFAWPTPVVPSSSAYDPRYQNDPGVSKQTDLPDSATSASLTSPGLLSPDLRSSSQASLSPQISRSSRLSRSISLASQASSAQSASEPSRSVSPNATEMGRYGYRNQTGSWNCAYPGCSSRSTFTRGCDLRKHYKRHSKTLFCRIEGCPQATEGGFSSKKDRARHEAKHNPNIQCEWPECDRVFSRVDNMKDHVRRVHERERRYG